MAQRLLCTAAQRAAHSTRYNIVLEFSTQRPHGQALATECYEPVKNIVSIVNCRPGHCCISVHNMHKNVHSTFKRTKQRLLPLHCCVLTKDDVEVPTRGELRYVSNVTSASGSSHWTSARINCGKNATIRAHTHHARMAVSERRASTCPTRSAFRVRPNADAGGKSTCRTTPEPCPRCCNGHLILGPYVLMPDRGSPFTPPPT